MRIATLHPWPQTVAEAKVIQQELRNRVQTSLSVQNPRWIAAADVSFERFGTELYAGVTLLDQDTGQIVESIAVAEPVQFPYVPGYLSFREIPPLLVAFSRLERTPDVVLCDGQGTAHPRRFGLACHLGLWLQIPTIGCAKSRLCGSYDDPPPERGNWTPLVDTGEIIGAVLRTRNRVAPLFVSSGHLCDLDSAIRITLQATGKYRLPEISRQAHNLVNDLRRQHQTPRPGS